MHFSYALVLLAAAASVDASPYPQGVTAKIAPSGKTPPGCVRDYDGVYGVAVFLSSSMKTKRDAVDPVTQIFDGQIRAPPATTYTMEPVTQTGNSQVQVPTGSPMAPITQIGDGQVQVPTGSPMAPITQIGDGQIQAPTGPSIPIVTQIGDGQIQAPTGPSIPIVPQIGDGQIHAPAGPPTLVLTQIGDGQIHAPTHASSHFSIGVTTYTTTTSQTTSVGVAARMFYAKIDGSKVGKSIRPVSTKTGGSGSVESAKSVKSAESVNAKSVGSGSVKSFKNIDAKSGGSRPVMSARPFVCKTTGNLELKLRNGTLTDSMERTGYIASNYQFQFDAPPQSGSLYTSGFSACSDGSVALGDSTVWWQCRSGNFYNIYDRYLAPQCKPVSLKLVRLVDC